jgi:hypothetical protein
MCCRCSFRNPALKLPDQIANLFGLEHSPDHLDRDQVEIEEAPTR